MASTSARSKGGGDDEHIVMKKPTLVKPDKSLKLLIKRFPRVVEQGLQEGTLMTSTKTLPAFRKGQPITKVAKF